MSYTTPLYGTGYEMGAIPLTSSDYTRASINSTTVKTGTYSLKLESVGFPFHAWAWYAVPVETSALYVSGNVYTNAGSGFASLGVILDSGEIVELRKDVTNHTWDLYVDGSLVQAGSIAVPNGQFQNVQAYFDIGNSGAVATKVDGVDDIDYSGDTQPGSGSTISYVQQYQAAEGVISYWDDLSFGTGDWGGDIRFDGLVPNGDDSVQWTPSTGADNYALVDEIPPSTADYVSTGTTAQTDKYVLGDWSGSAKTTQFVMGWVYTKKDAAGAIQLRVLVDSSGDEDVSDALDLLTADAYYSHLVQLDPHTSGSWADSGIDAMKIGIRSV